MRASSISTGHIDAVLSKLRLHLGTVLLTHRVDHEELDACVFVFCLQRGEIAGSSSRGRAVVSLYEEGNCLVVVVPAHRVVVAVLVKQ
jgi:hypothetical protein